MSMTTCNRRGCAGVLQPVDLGRRSCVRFKFGTNPASYMPVILVPPSGISTGSQGSNGVTPRCDDHVDESHLFGCIVW
jgi:hypothetical protein